MSAVSYVGPPEGDEDRARFSEIACDAFIFPPEAAAPYFEMAGHENMRIVRYGDEVAAGLVAVPMGQWWGGRSVATNGIGAVATAIHWRGRGAATAVLKAVLEELYERGTPISTLYPATRKLYRRVGYELAGLECEVELPCTGIDARERELEMRAVTPDDERQIHDVYRRWARRHTGNLDRATFNWRRIEKYRDKPNQGFVVCRGSEIEGFTYVRNQEAAGGFGSVYAHDVVALTPQAARRLLTFFADYRTTRRCVKWKTGPTDPLLIGLAECEYKLRTLGQWMLRIVDVPKALAARGYPAGTSGEIHFNVRDEVLPQNAGRWVLHVADGRGRAEAGGRGTFDVDIRGLAALYAGFLSPIEVIMTGRGEAPEEEQTTAASVFAGPIPWMRDSF